MKLRLIPKEERFFDLFVEDAANVLGAARLLDAMVRSYDEIERRAAEIREAEERGDGIGREIRERIDATFVPPFDRTDVLSLVRSLGDILDGIEEAADTFVLYRIETPTAAAVDLVAILVRQCEQVHEAMTWLPTFGGLAPYHLEIRRLEAEGDRIARAAVAALFDGGDAIEVIKWRKVYSVLETAIDRCEDVADLIERIALRNA
jgi:uncharacterized protein